MQIFHHAFFEITIEKFTCKVCLKKISKFFDVNDNVNSDFALSHFNERTLFKSNRYEVEFSFKETRGIY